MTNRLTPDVQSHRMPRIETGEPSRSSLRLLSMKAGVLPGPPVPSRLVPLETRESHLFNVQGGSNEDWKIGQAARARVARDADAFELGLDRQRANA